MKTKLKFVLPVVLSLALLACGVSAIQRAVNLVPSAVAAINIFESLAPNLSSTLDKVKLGLGEFVKVGNDYIANPSPSSLLAVNLALDTFIADFDSLLPNLDPRYKVAFTAADLFLHLIEGVVYSTQTSLTVPIRAKLTSHVNQTELKKLAVKEGLGKYIK